MENDTLPFYFTLFKDQGNLKYVYFLIVLIVYVAILFLNISIILAVIKEKSLHEPMYIFISCLAANALYGSTALFPRLSGDLLSDSHFISRTACFIQIFVIYSYGISEMTILATMAYDRYASICRPLHYHSIMTPRITALLISGAFGWAFFWIGSVVVLVARLPLCSRAIPRLYCSTWGVARLSCVSTSSNNALGLFVASSSVFLPSGFIWYSYIRILSVCKKSSSEFRGKALQTCLPHIVTFVTYSLAFYCDILLNRFELNAIMNIVAVAFSLEFLFIPPLLNPLIYGLTLPEMRKKNPFLRYLPRAAMFSKQ
ncbi:olfactory receptor 10J5-like [Denticeps clupeoides]|uniref:olfactory receptor 10J5-like n=1 Tax=Denticeps clupeoides TaxID=299321 RepID=UPI0010A4606E|nr:olfactory receptor 10J5-like [Denticeps clupeoides]XP_028837914.1 olfactory receptor 10J5-like [Denticeps clupeoides]